MDVPYRDFDDADNERHLESSLPPPPPKYEPTSNPSTSSSSKPSRSRSRSRRTMFLLLATLAVLAALLTYLWHTDSWVSEPWIPDPAARLFSQRPLPPPPDNCAITNLTLPLSTRGRDIVDTTGKRFKLSSINWYGASDELFIPGGLDIQHRSTIAATIRRLGFNSVRLPYADELVTLNPLILPHLLTANPDLMGLRALDILEACATALTDAGLAVIINNHITHATWCCGADPCDAGWANDHLGPLCRVSQTEDDWIAHWQTVMSRFTHNPLVIGADLRNEVRGVWGTMTWERWARAAERAGDALLALNPHWLIVVGGTESGNDLSGARARPVLLRRAPRQLVYSAHVYAWSGWGSMDGRFSKRAYPSFVKAMRANWGFLLEGDVAPVWIGEFGAPRRPGAGDANYWENLMRYLGAVDADFGYWAVNPRKPKGNAKESYALIEDDWVTPVVDYRLRDLGELMRMGCVS